MQESIIDAQKIRNELKSKRRLVFADFLNNPSNTSLALEIRALDDRISDLEVALLKQRNGDERTGEARQ